ncbi:MAG: LPS export ABC transporter permease LptG [Candidatus Koribacter versatilis]|uniref:LPS export ABC transporter permease LptG n=1 Tax=Candidatus Korobacter versatilis TaxID=658062 RepID=A0A932A6S1_9BACT|nr:LPS export ABC transporter permease LptG [Candidatus Koribacter versatilis]
MRIFTRYILKEVLAHAAIGTALFTFVVFMRDVSRILELVVRNSAPLPSVAEIFFLALPSALTVTIPMGVLVGILIGLSRLAADSEVTAMRASGLGVGLFVKTVAIFAASAWLIALVNQTFIMPRSAAALAALQNRLKTSQASFEVQPRVFYEDFRNSVLYVQDSTAADHAAVWKGIFLADISTPGAPKITLASEGIAIPEGENKIRLHLVSGSQHETVAREPDKYTITTFEETDVPIDIPQDTAQQQQRQSLSEISTPELLRLSHQPRYRWYLTEFHRRLALPTACLVLALVGIPLGLSSKKGGRSTGFVLTILLVFVYYFISLAGVEMARQGKIAPIIGAWMANLFFAATGAALLWRVDKMPLEIGAIGISTATLKKWWQRRRTAKGESVITRRSRRILGGRFPQILDDYILRDFISYVGLILLAFVTLTLIFTFFEILGDVVKNKIPLVTVGEYLLNVVPSMLYLMTPLSVLLAVLITFGLLQKGNEITAMKATGVSVYRVILPVLIMAAVISGALFFFDHFYLPHTNKRQDQLWSTIKGRPPETYLRPDRKWIFGQNSTIYYYEFYDPDQNRFGNISVFKFDPKTFAITERIFAARAHWEEDLGRWVFVNGWRRVLRGAAIEHFDQFDATTFPEVAEQPSYFKKEVKQSQEMDYGELQQYIHDLQQSGFDVGRLRVQLHRKFAFPLITFVMAVLAVPFALSAGRRGALAGVAIAIGIAVVYWMTSGLFEAMGNVHQLPAALAAWAPDLIFGMIGGYLILKVPT